MKQSTLKVQTDESDSRNYWILWIIFKGWKCLRGDIIHENMSNVLFYIQFQNSMIAMNLHEISFMQKDWIQWSGFTKNFFAESF